MSNGTLLKINREIKEKSCINVFLENLFVLYFFIAIPFINTLFLWNTQKAIKKLVLHNTLHTV